MNPALVLCSHGTSDPVGQEVVRRLVGAVRLAAGAVQVHDAVVDVEDHRLPTVLAGLDRPAVVVPLLLSTGFHVRHDIARAVEAGVGAGGRAVAAPALGPDWALAELGVRRLLEAGARRDDVVVLGGSGSSEAAAMADVDAAAARLADLWGGPVRVGHVGHRGDPLADVVPRLRRPGRRVVVASYLLAPGYFQDRLGECGADLVTGPLLQPSADALVVDLVLRRFAEAAHRVSWAPPAGRTR